MEPRATNEGARLVVVATIVVTGWVVTGATFVFALPQGHYFWAGPLVAAIGIETILSFFALLSVTSRRSHERSQDHLVDFALSIVAGILAIGAATVGTTLLR